MKLGGELLVFLILAAFIAGGGAAYGMAEAATGFARFAWYVVVAVNAVLGLATFAFLMSFQSEKN